MLYNHKDKNIIFISGGVRSGKSTFAEQEAIYYAQTYGQRLNYIATSRSEDEEMQDRIFRHEQQRLASGFDWTTFEIVNYFPENIEEIEIEGIILLDCLTVLLANELFATIVPQEKLQKWSEKVAKNIMAGITLLSKKAHTLFIVSNEIHYEIHDDPYVQTYQRTLGQLHQAIVKQSAAAYLVEVTVPRLMKGPRR